MLRHSFYITLVDKIYYIELTFRNEIWIQINIASNIKRDLFLEVENTRFHKVNNHYINTWPIEKNTIKLLLKFELVEIIDKKIVLTSSTLLKLVD